jgi:hypothetical protein
MLAFADIDADEDVDVDGVMSLVRSNCSGRRRSNCFYK